MARAGRETELIVSLIESAFGPLGVKVHSPYRITDKITGQLREVDVALEMTVGSAPVLVIVECREREGEQDVTWIEQLNTKRDHLGAAKAIAVSTSGFTKPALIAAKRCGIETRTLETLSLDTIKGWFKIKWPNIEARHSKFISAKATLAVSKAIIGTPLYSAIEAFMTRRNAQQAFIWKPTGKTFDANQLWQSCSIGHPIWHQVPLDGKIARGTAIVEFPNPEQRFCVEIDGKQISVKRIEFGVDLFRATQVVTISQVMSYRNVKTNLAFTLTAAVDMPNLKGLIHLVAIPESQSRRR